MAEQINDMVPPWEQFPTYERYSMGWRMGAGEQYIYDWSSFIDRLPKDYETRLDYLQRYRPAPLNWRDSVRWVLRPDVDIDQENDCGNSETERLLELGLIAYDAAYQTWLVGQLGIQWPWKSPSSDTPEEFARYRTREFWFFSRQFNTSRSKLVSEAIPAGWECVAWELLTGRVGQIDTSKGLLTLSKMLCAGCVQAPWVLGLTPVHCTDSFEMDMGYCDAYKLWLISAFDDKSLLTKILKPTEVPKNWADWMHMHTQFG